MELRNKRVLVVGLGESGLAMAKWLGRQGASVRVADSRVLPPNVDVLRAALPAAELICGPFVAASFTDIDLIAISPGVPVHTPQVQVAMARGVPVVSEIELFAWGVRRSTPQAKIIAITGSNGKTTTTALTAYLLNQAGFSAVACGNISPSALDALMAVEDGADGYPALPSVWVLELSSFQLETTHTLNADAATVLNISEDHLDRYAGMDDYVAAKARIFQGGGVMVLNRDDAHSTGYRISGRYRVTFGLSAPAEGGDYGISGGWIVRGSEKLIALESLRIAGLHNAANAMAALAMCEAIRADVSGLLPGLCSFSGLPHRVELIAEINGVAFYDDSKGTNVGATLAAIQGLGRKVAIILGGEGKEQDFSPLADALSRYGRAVALIGRDAKLIESGIVGCGVPIRHCSDMSDAVRWCVSQAQVGDAVLLSPACASFDMFKNYAHRAEVFVSVVRGLEREAA